MQTWKGWQRYYDEKNKVRSFLKRVESDSASLVWWWGLAVPIRFCSSKVFTENTYGKYQYTGSVLAYSEKFTSQHHLMQTNFWTAPPHKMPSFKSSFMQWRFLGKGHLYPVVPHCWHPHHWTLEEGLACLPRTSSWPSTPSRSLLSIRKGKSHR